MDYSRRNGPPDRCDTARASVRHTDACGRYVISAYLEPTIRGEMSFETRRALRGGHGERVTVPGNCWPSLSPLRSDERVQERQELLLLFVPEHRELGSRSLGFACVQQDGLVDRVGPAVVQIGG